MKTNEIIKSDLYEEVRRQNDTGFLTEDVVKVLETDTDNKWSEPMTAKELIAHMESLGIKA